MVLAEEGAAKFVVTEPEIGIEFQAAANGFFGVRKVAAIEHGGAESDIGFGKCVMAQVNGFAKIFLRCGMIAKGEMSHAKQIVGFVIGRGESDGLLEIGDRGLGIFIEIELLLAGVHEFHGLRGHGKFVGRHRGGVWRIGRGRLGNWFEIDGENFIGGHRDVHFKAYGLISGNVDGEVVGCALQTAKTEASTVRCRLGFNEHMLTVGKNNDDVFGSLVFTFIVDITRNGRGLLSRGSKRKEQETEEQGSETPDHGNLHTGRMEGV